MILNEGGFYLTRARLPDSDDDEESVNRARAETGYTRRRFPADEYHTLNATLGTTIGPPPRSFASRASSFLYLTFLPSLFLSFSPTPILLPWLLSGFLSLALSFFLTAYVSTLLCFFFFYLLVRCSIIDFSSCCLLITLSLTFYHLLIFFLIFSHFYFFPVSRFLPPSPRPNAHFLSRSLSSVTRYSLTQFSESKILNHFSTLSRNAKRLSFSLLTTVK